MVLLHPSSSIKCFCGRTYTTSIDLEEHRRARGHFPSHRCNGSCNHPPATPHDGRTHTCGFCGKLCGWLEILHDHRIATGHSYCAECKLSFPNPAALAKHHETVAHASEFKCCDCDMSFKNIHALFAHMKRSVHEKPAQQKSKEVSKNTECEKCKRTFSSTQALQQHCDSLKHKPLSDLSCPVGKGCRGKFTSPSALLHHLESGKCKSGIDRDDVYHMVQSSDVDGIIHTPLTLTPSSSSISPGDTSSFGSGSWAVSSDAGSAWSLLTPPLSQGSVEDSLEQWSLLERSQMSLGGGISIDATAVPSTLRCPLCPTKRSKFANTLALQQHMDSPIHGAKVYHCPKNLSLDLIGQNGKQKTQRKHFSTLSGLTQHLESGACKGGKRMFLQCIDLIQGRLVQLGFGGMRVLLPSVQVK